MTLMLAASDAARVFAELSESCFAGRAISQAGSSSLFASLPDRVTCRRETIRMRCARFASVLWFAICVCGGEALPRRLDCSTEEAMEREKP